MSRRGSLVGDAYVRIHADSSAMDRELRSQFNKRAQKVGTEGGKADAKAYFDSWDAESKRRVKGRRDELIRGIVGGRKEWDRQFKASGLASIDAFTRKARSAIKGFAGDVGDISPANLKRLQKSLNDLDKWAKDAKVAEALKQQRVEADKTAKSLRKLQEAVGASIVRDMKKQEKAVLDQDRAYQTYATNIRHSAGVVEDALGRMFSKEKSRQIEESNRLLIRAIVGSPKDWERAFQESGLKSVDKFAKEAKRRIRELDTATGGLHFDELERSMRELDRFARTFGGLTRVSRSMDRTGFSAHRLSNLLGRAFGKGSRNDFLNFIGSSVEGLSRLTIAIGKVPFQAVELGFKAVSFAGDIAFESIKGLGQLLTGQGGGGIGKAFQDLVEGFKEGGKFTAEALKSAAKSAGPAVVAIAGVAAAVSFFLPVILSALASIAAGIVALIGTISIGLVGAIAAATPVVLALAGAFGILVVAFTDMDKATRKQKALLKPLQKAWADLKAVIQGPVRTNILKGLKELAPVLRLITPGIKKFGEAFEAVFTHLGKLLTDKQFKPFIDAFNKTLPGIFEKFGRGLNNVAVGILAALKPILPFADRLAHNFEMLTTRFLDWATSAEGQTAITDFMTHAFEIGEKLWGILGKVGEVIGKVFAAGDKSAGGDFIDAILTKLTELSDFLSSPEGQQTMETFFKNAKEFARGLWQAITDIWTELQKIDWDQVGQDVRTVLETVGTVLAGIITGIDFVKSALSGMQTAWTNLGDWIISVYNSFIAPVFDHILGGVATVERAFANFFDLLGDVPGFGWAKDAADKMRQAATQADNVGDSIRRIPQSWETTYDFTVQTHLIAASRGSGSAAVADEFIRRAIRQRRGGGGGLFAAGGVIDEDGNRLMASGGILTAPRFIRANAKAGEAGREAIVPLDRPLQLVDRSVRALAAVARDMPMSKMASGGVLGGGGVNVAPGAIIVTVPNSDPALVAESVLDRIAVEVMA